MAEKGENKYMKQDTAARVKDCKKRLRVMGITLWERWQTDSDNPDTYSLTNWEGRVLNPDKDFSIDELEEWTAKREVATKWTV